MKILSCIILFLSVFPSVFAGNPLWHTYQSNIPKGNSGEVLSGVEIEGMLATIVVDNRDYTHERYFVLRTKDGRYVNLSASGVKEHELQKFSREHPAFVHMQVKKSSKKNKSGLIFLEGTVFDVRQKKSWIEEKRKKLLLPKSTILDTPKVLRVGFISINIKGRNDDSSQSVTPEVLNSFAAHVEAMTYGKIIIETGLDDVYHINTPDMPQLNCERGLWVLGNWAMKRAFPNGKNYDKYDRLVINYPFGKGENCGWWGVTYVRPDGLNVPLSSSFGYLLIQSGIYNNGVDVMVHEFGHSLGMWHSAMDKNGDGRVTKSEEYADPECVMARKPYSYNPIQLKKIGILDIGLGIEEAVDGEEYALTSSLTADPLGTGVVIHPISSNRPTPGIWGEELVAVKVRNFYINRSIEDENAVYIRQHLPMSYSTNRGYESLVVGRVEVGSSFRFPDRFGDGICVIGEEPDNAQIYISYHESMGAEHVCPSGKKRSTVGTKVAPPAGMVLVTDEAISTENRPTIKVLGVQKNYVVRIFNDPLCRNPVGFGIAQGGNINITTSELPPGHHTLFARSGPSISEMSDCSSARVDYGVAELDAPMGVTLLEPLTASHVDDTPKVRVEGLRVGDVVRLYTDELCKNSVSYPVESSGDSADIDTWPLPEGTNYQLYVQYSRANANRSDCWDSGLNYNVLVDENREPLLVPTLEMPEDISVLDGVDWRNEVVSDNNTPMIRIYPTTYNNGEVGIYTDSECTDKVGSVKTTPKRLYNEVLGKKLLTDYSYIPIYLKTDPLEPGEYTFYSQSTIGESFSECSTDFARYTVLPSSEEVLVAERPDPPTAITLSAADTDHSPTFKVDGVLSGDTVRLHRDSECLLPLEDFGSEAIKARDTNVLLTASKLFVGRYTVYASTTRNGIRSHCSSASASYEVLAPKPPAPKSIKVWGKTAGTNNAPIIVVGDSFGVYEYDRVKVYIDWACTIQVGEAVADYDPPGIWYNSPQYFSLGIRIDELPLGEHTFYATVTRDGRESDCSSAGDTYEVLSLDNGALNPPQRLKLIWPNDSEGENREPLIEVSGVKKSDVVGLFIDEECSEQVGENVVLKKGSIKIRSKNLRVGSYRFYSNRTRNGVTSACSEAYVDYTVLSKEDPSS